MVVLRGEAKGFGPATCAGAASEPELPDQLAHHLQAAVPDRRVQRDVGVYRRGPARQQGVRSRTHEYPDRSKVPFHRGHVHGSSSVWQSAVGVLASLDEHLHDVRVVAQRAEVEAGVAVLGRHFEVQI